MSQGRKRKVTVGFVALFVSALLLAGCNLAPPPAKVVKKKRAKPPAVKVEKMSVPEGWPKEIPMYPKAKIISVEASALGKKMVLKTPDSADKIFGWYYDLMEAQKWAIKGPTLDVAQNIAVLKGELGSVSVLLDARLAKSKEGKVEGSTITLTTPSPSLD